MVPIVHDLYQCLKKNEEIERNITCKELRGYSARNTELVKTLKNETLIHQSHFFHIIFKSSTAIVTQIQDDLTKLFAGEYNKIDIDKGEKTVDTVDILLT